MRDLLCYTYGSGSRWQAICVDLNISIEAKSQAEAMNILEAAVQSYVELAHEESPDQMKRLLSRRAPWTVRLGLWLHLQAYLFRHRREHDKSYAVIVLPCPA